MLNFEFKMVWSKKEVYLRYEVHVVPSVYVIVL